MSEDADVIQLVPKGDEDAPVRRKRDPQKRWCAHWHTSLNETARRVYCRDCDAELDAFDVLLMLSQHWERYESSRDDMKAQAKRAQAELEDLKRKVRNAKAQVRRASR